LQLIRNLHNCRPDGQRGCVLTIGNFDGVHCGHQALLARACAVAAKYHVLSVVMTFEPQPLEFFAPERRVPRLTRFREKYCHLATTGVDRLFVVRFDQQFAALSPTAFVETILCERLGAGHIIVGDDFQFGNARQGNVTLLQTLGKHYGFSVEIMPSVQIAGERVSSTRVRKALQAADHVLVERLLGRPYTMMGRVVYGNQLGRILGFPTANIYLHRQATPVQGIYAVRLHGITSQGLTGVANVGTRPTIGGTRTLLEVYLFDFNQTIYGKYVTVEFCKKLREEERFDTLELLRKQMVIDAEQAKAYFADNETA